MSEEEKTVYEAIQLLQNKSIDDVILEEILIHDSTEKILVVSLPAILEFSRVDNKNIQLIYKFCLKFTEDPKKSSCMYSRRNDRATIVTMRFVTISYHDFVRMKSFLVTHIKKLFFY